MRRSIIVALALTLGLLPARPDADEQSGAARLQRAIRGALPDGARVGVLARFADGAAPIVAIDPDTPLLPASTAKIFTTACALERLGPAYTFSTVISAQGALAAEGTLDGALFVVGGGDPELRAEDLWVVARELAALGIRRVNGGLVADDAALEPPGRPESWPTADDNVNPYHAAQGALALAWNSVEVVIRPGAAAGDAAAARLFPLDAPLRLVNRARTAGSTDLRLTIAEPDEPGLATLTVAGTIAAGAKPARRWVRLGDPTHALLAAFRDVLGQAGIVVDGELRVGPAPADARRLVRHASRPLAAIVANINKYSSNFGAELLLRALGRASAPVGSTRTGLDGLATCLDAAGVPRGSARLLDGSGYSRGNRVSAAALVTMLEHARDAAPWGPEFVVSLPRAAEDGSLRARLGSLAAAGVRAKTGSLSGVAGLAGYARTVSGRELTFAILINDGPRHRGDVHPAHADRLLATILETAERLDHEPPAAD